MFHSLATCMFTHTYIANGWQADTTMNTEIKTSSGNDSEILYLLMTVHIYTIEENFLGYHLDKYLALII